MALTLPSQNTKGTTLPAGKLTLPDSPDADKKRGNLNNLAQATLDARIAAKENSRTLLSRFTEELGGVAKEIGQSTARSFLATGQALSTPGLNLVEGNPLLKDVFTRKYTPDNKFEKALVGDKQVSFETVGQEFAPLLEKVGISKELTNKFSVPIGLFAGALDVLQPGSGGARRKALELLARSTDEAEILTTLKTLVKGDAESVKALATTLKGVDKVADVEKLLDVSLKDSKVLSKVPRVIIPKALDAQGRKLFGVSLPEKVTRLETTLLKEKVKALERGAKMGAEGTRAGIFNMQDAAIGLITKHLPVSARGPLLKVIRDANTPDGLIKAVDRIDEKIKVFDALREEQKYLGSQRSKVAFLTKVGGFNSTAVSDVKKSLGITTPIKDMTTEQLDLVIGELKTRLSFAREKGFLDIPKKANATKVPEEYLQQFVQPTPGLRSRVTESATNFSKNFKETADDYVGVISTQLANIDSSLKYALRKFEYNSRVRTLKDQRVTASLGEKLKSVPPDVLQQLDAAMKNGAIENVEEIAAKYGFTKELGDVRQMLDAIYGRAKEVDLDVAYRKNYFPRQFKNDERSVQGILAYFEKADKDGLIKKALTEKERVLKRTLTNTEKVNTINTLLRGFRTSNVTLSKTGSLEQRIIDEITPELNQYYENSIPALFSYVEKINNLIESRRFFGKHLDLKKMTSEDDLTDVIGGYVNNLVASGKISSIDETMLKRILEARFSSKQMGKTLGALKNVGYITVMGSPLNAITQIGDLGLAYYRAGGRGATGGLKDALANVAGAKNLSRADIGIDNIAAEFSNQDRLAKLVTQTFRVIGLDKIDRLGKETFINGVFRTSQREAKATPEAFANKLRPIFGNETDAVVKDFANGVQSENVKYFLFNELLDFQPAALSEVPLKYLESPNGRIFYALKTYMIKLWDIYRRESFQKIKNGDVKGGLSNLVKLTAILAAFNATAGEIKNLITGEDTEFSDALVDNIAKAYGFSKYTISQIGKEGLGRTIAEQILPPTQLFDDVSKDIGTVASGDANSPTDLKSFRNVPIIGKLSSYWFGNSGSAPTKSSTEIPSVNIPAINIPSVDLPAL